MNEQILEKWKILIDACKAYYVDAFPTGLTDSEYDWMEKQAMIEDSFSVRDYVFQTFLKGTKTKNAWIEKIKKTKVTGKTMFDAIREVQESRPSEKLYFNLKYDGSSIAIYIDPTTGIPLREVTVGNLNLDSFGVDQTWKLHSFLPSRFPIGIKAIQCEALIDTTRLSDVTPERARQKSCGLINSLYCDAEVNNLLTLRAYRYYTDDSPAGLAIRSLDYREVLQSFETTRSHIDGHILFAPADTWTFEELLGCPGYTETDLTKTTTGVFLNDGWVVYDEHGINQGALKYEGAGSGTEGVIKTKVRSIQWNNQVPKGKDSWSANVIIDPVVVRGCTVKKPSAGSVGKMVKKTITPGAEVSIILANSTIPVVSEVFTPGDGNFMWPTCSCGYQMSESDVYGSLLKCGNPACSERITRMRGVISGMDWKTLKLDLGKLLVIDRFKWETTGVSEKTLLGYVENGDPDGYRDYLMGFMKTDLQKRNMGLVWEASYKVLREKYEAC